MESGGEMGKSGGRLKRRRESPDTRALGECATLAPRGALSFEDEGKSGGRMEISGGGIGEGAIGST